MKARTGLAGIVSASLAIVSVASADPGPGGAGHCGRPVQAPHYDGRYYGGAPRTRHCGGGFVDRHGHFRHQPIYYDGPRFTTYRGGCRSARLRGHDDLGFYGIVPFCQPGITVVVPVGRVFVVLDDTTLQLGHVQPLFGHLGVERFQDAGLLGYQNPRDFYSTSKSPRDYARFYRENGGLERSTERQEPRSQERPQR